MKKDKLQSYALTGSIHTIAIKSQGVVEDVQEEVDPVLQVKSNTAGEGPILDSPDRPEAI